VKANISGNPFLWFGYSQEDVDSYMDLFRKNGLPGKTIRDYEVTEPLLLIDVSDPETLRVLQRAGANTNVSFKIINGEVRRQSSEKQANKNRQLVQQIRGVLHDRHMDNNIAGWHHGKLKVHNDGTTQFVKNCVAKGEQEPEALLYSPGRRGVVPRKSRGSPSGIPSRDPSGSPAGTSASAGRNNNNNKKKSVAHNRSPAKENTTARKRRIRF
jgi:hypothetical protein